MEAKRDVAFNLAKRLYQPYIERGDTLKQIADGMLGYGSDEGSVQTGGWVDGKKLKPNQVAVELPDRSRFIFKLEDFEKAIKGNGSHQLALF